MKRIILYISVAFLLLSAFSCANRQMTKEELDGSLTIGTFNVEWLGDGKDDKKPRQDLHLKTIAEVISESNFDIVGLEEIENEAALSKLVAFLPDYKFYVGKHGDEQNVAVLYRNNLDVRIIGENLNVQVDKEKTRPGLVVEGKKDNFDFVMMVVHFKSTSRYDDTPQKRSESIELRKKQSRAVSVWVDSVIASGREKDIFVVGDFNDYLEREGGSSIDGLRSNKNVTFLTAGMTSCKNERWYVIDHIVASSSAEKRFLPHSLNMHNFRYKYPKEVYEMISDHCPISASFETKSPDND